MDYSELPNYINTKLRNVLNKKKVFIVRIVYFKKKELAVNMSLFPAPKDRTIPTPDWQFRLKRMEVWPGVWVSCLICKM